MLEQYPLGVVEECCDPRIGLAKAREFPPTVAAVSEWCDKRVTYHRGMVSWGKKRAKEAAETGQFSEEHQRSMLKRLQDLMHGIFRQSKEATQ